MLKLFPKYTTASSLLSQDAMATFSAALCAVLWSFLAVITKQAQLYIDSFQFLFFSNVLSLLSLIFFLYFRENSFYTVVFANIRTIKHAAILGSLDGLFYLLIYKGYKLENGVAVLAAQYSWPLLVVMLSVFIFHHIPHIIQIIGLFLGFAALVVMFYGNNTLPTPSHLTEAHSWLGIGLVLAGAFCFALLSVLSRYFKIPPIAGTFWLFVFSTCSSAILFLMFGTISWPTYSAWMPITVNGIAINGLSYVIWIWAMRHGDAAKISSMVFLSPILSVIWLVFLAGEAFIPLYALSLGGVICAGILCFSFSRKQPNPAKPS